MKTHVRSKERWCKSGNTIGLGFCCRPILARIQKKEVLNNIKPIKRAIYGESYIIYALKRCVWQGTAGNLLLVRGVGFGDFISLFTTGLNTKS